MTLIYLTALCLFIAGIHVDGVGSAMCDDGWVYHSDTESCLQVITERFRHIERYGRNPCQRKNGGEFRNISGNIVKFNESMQPYLKDYLKSINVRAAAVEFSLVKLLPDFYLFTHSDRHRERLLFDTLSHLKQLTYFVPEKTISFTLPDPYVVALVCQVKAGPIEPPVCPRDVKLVSLSDRDVTLSWSPGELGRRVTVNIKVQTCDDVSLSCDDFTNTTFSDVSLFESMNYTVTGLQPNTKHQLVLQILSDKYVAEDCNITLALTTNEEYTVADVPMSRKQQPHDLFGVVVGLSALLIICFCLCLVLATLLFRSSRQSKGKDSNDTQKIDAEVLKSKTDKPEVNLQVSENMYTSDCLYLNVQDKGPTYDKPDDQEDGHIYEMS